MGYIEDADEGEEEWIDPALVAVLTGEKGTAAVFILYIEGECTVKPFY